MNKVYSQKELENIISIINIDDYPYKDKGTSYEHCSLILSDISRLHQNQCVLDDIIIHLLSWIKSTPIWSKSALDSYDLFIQVFDDDMDNIKRSAFLKANHTSKIQILFEKIIDFRKAPIGSILSLIMLMIFDLAKELSFDIRQSIRNRLLPDPLH